MIEGVDYSWGRPDPGGLYAAGKRFTFRYLSYNTTGKNITATERDALWAAGLAVCLNWENRSDDASDGYDGGHRNATEALKQARALGFPESRPIYFSIDEDTSSNPGRVDAYLNGVGSVLPVSRIGVYGGYSTVKRAHETGAAAWLWQTYAWSGGRWYPGVHVQQYRNGVLVAGSSDCDLDRAMVSDYGQWTGDDMELTTKLSTGVTVDAALVTMLARTDYLANRAGLAASLLAVSQKLDTLVARSDDPQDVTVTLDDAAKATIGEIRDAVTALRVPTADEIVSDFAGRLAS